MKLKSFRQTLLAASAVAALAFSATAQAAEFTLFIYETPSELAKRTDTTATGQAYWSAYDRFGKALAGAGVLLGGAALQGPSDAKTVRATDPTSARPGAYLASATPLGGFFIIDVKDMAQAVEWAAKAPAAGLGGAIEVRPAYPLPPTMR